MWTILLGRIVQFLLMLATLRIATTVLTPAEMGKIAIMTTTVAFVSSFLINPVGMYVNRHLHRWQTEGSVTRHIKSHYVYVLLIALLAALILGLFSTYGLINMHLPCTFVMLFVFLTLFFNTVNQTAIPSLNLLGFRGWFTVLSVATILFGLMFAVFMVMYFDAETEYWLLGILMGQILFALIGSMIFYFKTKITSPIYESTSSPVIPAQAGIHFSRYIDATSEIDSRSRANDRTESVFTSRLSVIINRLKSVFQFGWPIAIAIGLTWFQSQSYRFFIEDAFGLSALGLFVAGYGISAGIIAGFESVFVTYFQPIFYQAVSTSGEQKRADAWNNYAQAIIPSLLLVAMTLIAVSSKLTLLMLAPAFQSAAAFVMWGALIETCRVLVNVYSMAAHASLDTKRLILPNLLGAVLAIVLMYRLIPIFGLVGVGCALTVAGFAVVVFLHIMMRKSMTLFLPKQKMMQALLFGSMIWFLSRSIDHFLMLDHTVLVTLLHMGCIGLIFIMVELYVLKIRETV